MKNNIKGINFAWGGSGFGNALVVAQVTKIAIDNEIPAVFSEHKTVKGLVDVPLYNSKLHKEYIRHSKPVRNTYERKNVDEPVIIKYIKDVSDLTGKKIVLKKEHNCIPVKFYDIPETPSVDVALCTVTGDWSLIRQWKYFEELKKWFDKNKITYVDLNKEGIYGIKCLNYVKKCKLYLGLDTGMSHYVSKFANGKALIIQSGFNLFNWWSYTYDYDCITSNVKCEYRPCFLDRKYLEKGFSCPYNERCINDIKVKTVFYEVTKRL